MSCILIIIAPVDFQDHEFGAPKSAFEKAGHSVTVCSKGVTTARGAFGSSASVDVDISEVAPKKYDAVVFVGGAGAAGYFNDPDAHRIAREIFASGGIAAGICIGPSILANAGLLEGKRATVFGSEEANLRDKGAIYTGKDVEVDGRIVTANGPMSAEKFAEEILKLL